MRNSIINLYHSFLEYFDRVKKNFGRRFVILIFAGYFFGKGIAFRFTRAFQLPFYQKFGVTSLVYQSYRMVGMAPWSMKGFIGCISDAWPLWGWHKTSWMSLASFFGVFAASYLVLIPINEHTIVTAPLMIFLISVQIATTDLLCEGKYAEFMGKMPEVKADIVTLVWALIMVGGLIGVSLAGLLVKVITPIRLTLIIVLVSLILASIPIFKKYMPETRLPPGSRGILWGKMRQRFRLFLLAFVMAFVGLGFSAIVLVGSSRTSSEDETGPTRWTFYQMLYSVVTSILLCVGGFWALPRILAMCNVFLFLQEVLYVQIQGSIDYWYTAKEQCVPGGPGFSYTYYIMQSEGIGNLAGVAGVILFQKYCSNWTFRQCFWISTLVRIMAASFDMIIINRLNLRVGIPDEIMYLLGDAIVYNMLEMLAFMPTVVLTSKICPKGMEATVYALLAGFQNFGQGVAQSAGLYLQSAFDVEMSEKEGFDCKYDNLTLVILVAHIILPLLTIPLTFLLIPDARLGDDLLAKFSAINKGDYGGIGLVSEFLTNSEDCTKEHYDFSNVNAEVSPVRFGVVQSSLEGKEIELFVNDGL